uniref:Uncharacterized protein n=1 Tax=Globodera pallida TaxID=36090 RepID=A0A183CJ59_GLOPA
MGCAHKEWRRRTLLEQGQEKKSELDQHGPEQYCRANYRIGSRLCPWGVNSNELKTKLLHTPADLQFTKGFATAKEEDGKRERAEDATSLDTWLTRRRHRRRNTLNLSLAGRGNGNSRFGRLVSSLSKLREAFSLSSTRANGGGTTKVTEEVQQQQQQQKVQGTEWAPEAQSTALPPLGEHCQWLRCRLFVDNEDGEGTDAVAGRGNMDSSNRTKSAEEVVSDGWMSIMTLDH